MKLSMTYKSIISMTMKRFSSSSISCIYIAQEKLSTRMIEHTIHTYKARQAREDSQQSEGPIKDPTRGAGGRQGRWVGRQKAKMDGTLRASVT